ncbi:MAG: type II secretion system protein [Planctomycetota bacterium]
MNPASPPRNHPGPIRSRNAGSIFRGGFTLVEMVVSLVVIAVLLVGMSSAIVLASRALPHAANPAGATVDSARALHEIRDELRAATELPVFSATSVTLHLPDRDNDGRPEVVTYAWGGSAGDPLTRTVQGGEPVTVLDDVQSLALDYVCENQDTVFPGGGGTSAEVELSSYDPGDSADEVQIKDGVRLGFRFTPALPSNASTWRVTRVLMRTSKSGGTGGTATFELTGWDDASGPTDTVLESVDIDEPDLDQNQGWAQIDFATGGPFDAGDTAAISLEDTGGAAAKVLWNSTGTPPNAHDSTDGGVTWLIHDSDGAADHFVYGAYETTGDDWTHTQHLVTRVDIELVHGRADAVTHTLALALPNAPEATDALWEADFNADPTALDYQDDGAADWKDDGGFDDTNLADGRWSVTNTMCSAPDSLALDGPFLFDAWLEDTVNNGDGGGVRLRFDRTDGQHAYVLVKVNLEAAGQVVTVDSENAAGTLVEWVNQTLPAGEAVHVGLAADPENDVVGVVINSEVVGSFAYESINTMNNDVIRPFTDGGNSGVVLDHVRLATGGLVANTPGAYTGGSGSSGTSGGSGSGGTSDTTDGGSSTTESGSGSWWEALFGP